MHNPGTGETLCDADAEIILEKMVFPEPVIAQAVEPKTKVDQEKMGLEQQRSRSTKDETVKQEEDGLRRVTDGLQKHPSR